MAHTVGTFFYRSDIVKPEEVPKTFDELVTVSQRLQKEGKAKWGYVGGMTMNNTWFSLVVDDVVQQLRHPQAAVRARQREAQGGRASSRR